MTEEDRERFIKHSHSKVAPPRFKNRVLPKEWEDCREMRQEPVPLSELAKTQAERDAEEETAEQGQGEGDK